jgi:hypothetical protein
MNYMHKLKHKIAHLFGWNYGTVETWHEGQTLMVGFRCKGCNTLSGAHPVSDNMYNDKPDHIHE